MKHAEGYIRSFQGKKLLTHTPDNINGYFKNLARNPLLKDWHFAQNVDAIQKMFEMIGAACVDQVD